MLNDYQGLPDAVLMGTQAVEAHQATQQQPEAKVVVSTPEMEFVGVVQSDQRYRLLDELTAPTRTKNGSVHHVEAVHSFDTPEMESIAAITTTIILPAYNEAAALPEVLKSLQAALDDTYEVLVVDDGSTDETPEIARTFPFRLICHQKNQGKGAAVRTGLAEARGQYIVVMDADNTYPAEAIPDMVTLLAECDFVRGIRRIDAENTPIVNRIGNKFFDTMLRVMYGLEGGDHLTGLYGLKREAFQSMHFVADGFDLEVEIGIKARAHNLSAGLIPIEYRERLGEKKLRPLQDGWRILHRMLSLALLYNPARIFIAPGLLLWGVAALFTLMLGGGPFFFPQAGFSLPAFVVAAIGIPAGFQLIVFGIAAALYGVERHIPPKGWLLTLSRARVRFWAGVVSVALIATSVAVLLFQGATWIVSGARSNADTPSLIMSLMFLLWGVQGALAVLFVSIFSGRIEKLAVAHAAKRTGILSLVRRSRGVE